MEELCKEAKSVDDSSLRKFPLDVLKFVDKPQDCNPDLFQAEMMEDAMKYAEKIKQKADFLQVLHIITIIIIITIIHKRNNFIFYNNEQLLEQHIKSELEKNN